MKNETEESKVFPILKLLFRVIGVYLAAKFFFKGLEDWQNSQYMLVGMDFSIVTLNLGQVFQWFNHPSKVVQILMWLVIPLPAIFLILSKLP